jgi:hypothetical protein
MDVHRERELLTWKSIVAACILVPYTGSGFRTVVSDGVQWHLGGKIYVSSCNFIVCAKPKPSGSGFRTVVSDVVRWHLGGKIYVSSCNFIVCTNAMPW